MPITTYSDKKLFFYIIRNFLYKTLKNIKQVNVKVAKHLKKKFLARQELGIFYTFEVVIKN